MALVTSQATFTRYADGSVRIICVGGTDPSLTPAEGEALTDYLNATEKLRGKVFADAKSSVSASVAAADKAAADAALATAHTIAAANTEIVLPHEETDEEKAVEAAEVAAEKAAKAAAKPTPAKPRSHSKAKTVTVTTPTVTSTPVVQTA